MLPEAGLKMCLGVFVAAKNGQKTKKAFRHYAKKPAQNRKKHYNIFLRFNRLLFFILSTCARLRPYRRAVSRSLRPLFRSAITSKWHTRTYPTNSKNCRSCSGSSSYDSTHCPNSRASWMPRFENCGCCPFSDISFMLLLSVHTPLFCRFYNQTTNALNTHTPPIALSEFPTRLPAIPGQYPKLQ